LYTSNIRSKENDALFEAILKLENIEECYKFFEDVCTINEIQAMSQRLNVAKLLHENYTYSQIEKMTGVSTATISRISKCLHYGPGGYKIVLEK
jgi:TrpR-related protein YerC/YecD